uniref:Interleukin-11 n=1 Tax=Anolis carolinensis TaxID=28377 RepID=H9GMS6_ANOCA
MKNCLCQVLVVLLSLCEGPWAAPRPKPFDPRIEFDSIVNLARNLLSDTKSLFNHFKTRYPAEGEHKLETLPVLSMNAVELANIQVSGGLARLSSDLQCYQRHFEWLRKAATLLRPMEHDIGTVHNRLDRLLKRLEHLVRVCWTGGLPGSGSCIIRNRKWQKRFFSQNMSVCLQAACQPMANSCLL